MRRPAGLSLRVQDGGAGAICADILAALPHWFGVPASVAAYYFGRGFRPLEEMPEVWGPDQPALQMIKTVSAPS